MTNTTEQTKRQMYNELGIIRGLSHAWKFGTYFERFESKLEVHLEDLRKDLKFACAQIDLNTARMSKLVQERDDIQGRLHAIDHAYHVQSQANAAAGDELRHCKEVITKQRLAIEALTGLLETRKTVGATLAQASEESLPKLNAGAFLPRPAYPVVDCCQKPQVYRDGSGDLHCRSCGA